MPTPATGQGHGGVFLSYRREDTKHLAGRLYDRLTERFGSTRVFMDVDSIEPGTDFATAIDTAVASCAVLLALIGPNWLDAHDEDEQLRLEDPDDFVALEITAALRKNVRVLPVLVDGTSPPSRRNLPEALRPLARRHAMRLDHDTFRTDLDALLDVVAKIITAAEAAGGDASAARDRTSREQVDEDTPRARRSLSDRYELGERLGRGGMSEVRRGLDRRLSREVAIKVLRADLARDPQFQLRFRREAQNAAALNHPAIVAVHDTGEIDGDLGPVPYIVMEYIDGVTLREIVRTQGPMPSRRVVEVMADVCAALDFSHEHGIIHRDVQPTNIMINRAGAVKVTDFGLAKALGDGNDVTRTAAVIGTAQYLSPEQVQGETVDARSDVYAAGCVAFELLTGQPPFSGDTPVAVADQHVRGDPPTPSRLKPSVPPQLDAIVLKALSKNPANRYQSAAEMRADLLRTRAGEAPLAPVVMKEDERAELLDSGSPGSPHRADDPAVGRTPPGDADDNDDAYDRFPDGRTARRIAIGVATTVILCLLGLMAYLLFGGTATVLQVAVPNVAGLQLDYARDEILRANLRLGSTVEHVAPSDERDDTVVATDPAAGTWVAVGSAVTLRVGSAQTAVPPLVGRTVEEAADELSKRGLALGTPTEQSVTDPAQVDKIVASTPAAGENVARGTTVTVVVGR